MGANVRLMRGIRLVGLARAYSDMPAASIGRSPRSDAGHPVLDQADFSGQPLDLPTNPASMEAGLRHLWDVSAPRSSGFEVGILVDAVRRCGFSISSGNL